MRRHAEWMAQADDRILEYLRREGPRRPNEIRFGLASIGDDVRHPQRYVDERLDALAADGLVAQLDDRWACGFTDAGAAYLRGDVDASSLPRPDRRSGRS